LAKYPFLPEANEYIKSLELTTTELPVPQLEQILLRAETRVENAIRSTGVRDQIPKEDVEIPSFPIAIMMVAASGNSALKRRYALAEAKRISAFLKDEPPDKIVMIARNFNWNIRVIKIGVGEPGYDFAINFVDFLKNAANIQDEKWKLVNRTMLNGEVYATRSEASRLLQEEIRRHIEEKLDTEVGLLSESIMNRIDRLKNLFIEMKGKIQAEEMPKEVIVDAFPPCIRELRNKALTGQHISHIGRFALTSFLISSGMTVENVVECFRPATDFSEKMTRYQVEHIAGTRGSRTKYTPPKCDTLRTHGVCPGMDEICRHKVRHPLGYYQRRIGMMKTQTPAVPVRG